MLVYLVCTCELCKSINESIQARSPCGMLVTKMKEIEDGTFVAINRDKRMKYLVETKQCKWGSTYIFPVVCFCVLLPENKALDKKHVRKKSYECFLSKSDLLYFWCVLVELMYCTCCLSQGKVQAWQDSRNQYLRYLSKVLQGKARRAPWWRNMQRCCRCMFLWFLLQRKTFHLESKLRFDSTTIYVYIYITIQDSFTSKKDAIPGLANRGPNHHPPSHWRDVPRYYYDLERHFECSGKPSATAMMLLGGGQFSAGGYVKLTKIQRVDDFLSWELGVKIFHGWFLIP